ncbi:MAG: PilZ domain-containing protein [Candidatus Omnitrophota bacterium]
MAGAYEHVFLTTATDVYYRLSEENHKLESNALVTEMSNSGLKFINTELIPKNTILELKIILDSKSPPILAQTRVLWQRQVSSILLNSQTGKGCVYDTAVVFTNFAPGDKQILADYMHHFTEKIASNRAHLRFPLVLDAKVSLADINKKQEYDCVIGDIGVQGVKLFIQADIALNTKIYVRFELPDAFGCLNLLGIIVRKIKTNQNVWALGIEFSKISIEEKETILDFISSRLPG